MKSWPFAPLYFLLYMKWAISKPSLILQFYDQLGVITDNPMKESFFTIVVTKGARRFILRARRHDYHSNLKMFSDPCIYSIGGFFSYNSGMIDFCNFKLNFFWGEYIYKVNFSDLAKNKEFLHKKDIRVPYKRINRFKLKKDLLKMHSGDNLAHKKNSEKYSGEKILRQEFHDKRPQYNSDYLYLESSSIRDGTENLANRLKTNPDNEDQYKTKIAMLSKTTVADTKTLNDKNKNMPDIKYKSGLDVNETRSTVNFSKRERKMGNLTAEDQSIDKYDKDYLIRIFIFNDIVRVNQLGLDINKNTLEIFKIVEGLYKQTIIQPVLSGILNLTEKIEVKSNVLESFKDSIDPLRFSPFNLNTPLYRSDLIVLLSGDPLGNGPSTYQGMSFYGGANKLDSSYSVVSTSSISSHFKNDNKFAISKEPLGSKIFINNKLVPNSNYFIAKKMAHEIAHSLGVMHDKLKGHLMEPSTCKDCNELERVFSKQSVDQMTEFILYNKKVFAKKPIYKYSSDHTIKSLADASEYASERRRHSFMDIVKTRLKGQMPMRAEMNAYLSMCFLIYGVVIYLIIRYFK